jgi:heterodisulfide reductase subunit B
LPAHSLFQAEKQNLNEVIVPCAECFSRLKTAVYEINKDENLAKNIDLILGHSFSNKIKVLHPLEIFNNIEEKDKIKKNVVKNMSDIKAVCYYGCLLTRPPKVMQFDVCENPQTMDNLLKLIGINVLDWSYKTDCCGASFSLTQTDIVLNLTHDILEEAKSVGADVISVACPLCHSNLDTRQDDINKKFNTDFEIPILYFTQLMGLSFGISPEKLGLKKHLVNTTSIINKVKSQETVKVSNE